MSLNIKQLRTKKGLTQAELAEKLGVSRATIINWEKGVTGPDHDEAQRMSKLFNIDLTKIDLSRTGKDDDVGKIPFYDAVAVGGTAVLADQAAVEQPTEMIEPGTWFKQASGALRVYGHSMFPKYPSGCIVAFKVSVSDVPSVIVWGEDYVIELEDRRILKRVEKGEDKETIRAVSYNVNKDQKYVYDPIDIPRREIKRMYIVLGKVELEASI